MQVIARSTRACSGRGCPGTVGAFGGISRWPTGQMLGTRYERTFE